MILHALPAALLNAVNDKWVPTGFRNVSLSVHKRQGEMHAF